MGDPDLLLKTLNNVRCRSMGGVIAADVATYYGPELIGGVVLLGSFPHRNMLGDVSTPWIVEFLPRLFDADLAEFGPIVKEFVESYVAFGDRLDQLIKYSWMGVIAGQNPEVRVLSIPHTQNETALMNVRATIPYLALHGNMDKLVDGVKLRAYMDQYFGNFAFRYLTDVGHAFFWDAPAETNQEIIAFAMRLSQVSISRSFSVRNEQPQTGSQGWTRVSGSPDGPIYPPPL
jgi:pimeloyl-ACP methyl ester carboxylesterase